MLADNKIRYDLHKLGMCDKTNPSAFGFYYIITELQKEKEWMKEIPTEILRTAGKRLGLSFKEFFSGKRGYPRFRARGRNESFDLINGGIKITHIKGKHYHVKFPKHKSKMLLVGENTYNDGKIVKATIKNEQGKWYAYVSYKVSIPERENNGTAIGVDCNAGQVAASNETIYRIPDVSKLEARRKRYQRMMSRRVKGSNRRNRARQMMAKTSSKICLLYTSPSPRDS